MKTITRLKLRTILKYDFYQKIKQSVSTDLLKRLEQEITLLGLKDNLYAIARYIYIRLGELFVYDNQFMYAPMKVKKVIRNARINSKVVLTYKFVCDSYAYLYVELLNHFGIEADVVDTKDHVYVVYNIENKVYLADLTSGNVDITRIKFGLAPIYNRQIYPEAPKIDHTFDEIDKKIYINGITTEEALDMVKKELLIQKQKENWNEKEYIYAVYKTIERIMNFDRPSIGFVSGVTYIYYLLRFFISQNYEIRHNYFLDNENNLEMEVFTIQKDAKMINFSFKENKEGFYEFREVSYQSCQEEAKEENLHLVRK